MVQLVQEAGIRKPEPEWQQCPQGDLLLDFATIWVLAFSFRDQLQHTTGMICLVELLHLDHRHLQTTTIIANSAC